MTRLSGHLDNDDSYIENLRRERDRFVALAFCAADVLVEVDSGLSITYAAGATVALTGTTPDSLLGRSLLEIITGEDRPLLNELIHGMTASKRLEPVAVRFVGTHGVTQPLMLTGYLLPDLPDSMFFALRLGSQGAPAASGDRAGRDSRTGLLHAEAFAAQAAERMKADFASGRDVRFSLIRLQDFAAFYARLDPEAGELLTKTISACLRVMSGSSETASRLDERNYGVVHDAEVDVDDVTARISEHLKNSDSDGRGIPVAAGTVDIESCEISDTDLVAAIRYAVDQFCDENDFGAARRNFSENLVGRIETASRKVSDFRDIVSGANFDVAFQPIIEIATSETIHYEALTRFSGGSERSPYELITFAGDAGLICDFDFAMCRKLLALLEDADHASESYSIAVNLSGRSVINEPFLAAIEALLKKHPGIRRRLIFELTEAQHLKDFEKTGRFIKRLRAEGHQVCLDDFGGDVMSLKFLHHLDFDLVKIDGHTIQGGVTDRKQRAFLGSITRLCRELGIETIAKLVEKKEVLGLLEECGIRYGQGYLFGKPSLEIQAFAREIGASRKTAPPRPPMLGSTSGR